MCFWTQITDAVKAELTSSQQAVIGINRVLGTVIEASAQESRVMVVRAQAAETKLNEFKLRLATLEAQPPQQGLFNASCAHPATAADGDTSAEVMTTLTALLSLTNTARIA